MFDFNLNIESAKFIRTFFDKRKLKLSEYSDEIKIKLSELILKNTDKLSVEKAKKHFFERENYNLSDFNDEVIHNKFLLKLSHIFENVVNEYILRIDKYFKKCHIKFSGDFQQEDVFYAGYTQNEIDNIYKNNF